MTDHNKKTNELYDRMAEIILLLSPAGPLYALIKQRKAREEKQTESEEDVLKLLEIKVKSAVTQFEYAISQTKCSLCRNILEKIKAMPIESQAVALSELVQFMKLAEQGSPQASEYLKNTKVLKDIVKEIRGGNHGQE